MKDLKPILLVEDDRVDAMTVERALTELNIANPLVHVVNGEDALEFLQNPESDAPHLILLDLNMPRMNGVEFLGVVKNDDRFKHLPVIVVTTSKEESDKIEAFRLGVAGYMAKPLDYIQFVEVIKTINSYWTLCELPDDSCVPNYVPAPDSSN